MAEDEVGNTNVDGFASIEALDAAAAALDHAGAKLVATGKKLGDASADYCGQD